MKKNRSIRALALIVLTALIFLFLCGCKNPSQVKVKKKDYYQYFDTVSTIYDYTGGSEDEFRQTYSHFEEKLGYYHKLFDIYNEYDGINNIATINKQAGKEAVKVDASLIEFLEFGVEMFELTDGNVNIAMGSVLSIWHTYRTAGVAIPKMEELKTASAHTDIGNMIIDRENSTVYLSDPEMSLDVGAIAKGYAAEKIASDLVERGITSYVIDLGGNLRAIGSKKDGSSWKTGVQNPNPTASEPYVYYLYITDTSVVTSGDYQRKYTVDGKDYHHIINKDTLMPSDHFSSVTVVTKDSGLADALSTALFNMDYEEGKKLLSSLTDVSCVWVTTDGNVVTYGLD